MRQKHILFGWGILLVAGMICFSCTKEYPVGNEEDKGKEAFFSVHTICDELTTKASEHTGTAAEFHVEKVRIVLYDGTEGLNDNERTVLYAFDYDIKTNYLSGNNVDTDNPWISANAEDLYDGGTPDASAFTTYARKVEKQDYLILVIVNPTLAGANGDSHASLTDITAEGNTLAAFQNNAISISRMNFRVKANGGVAQDKYFLMTNHKGLVKVSADALKTSITEAHISPVSVAVDRVVAKVQVTKNAAFEVLPAGATADRFTWELDITNRMTYWMRIKDLQRGGTAETDATRRDDIYAKDPNFENFSGDSDEKKILRSNHFNTVYTEAHTGDFTYALNAYQYTLENTMGESDQGKEEVMTRVVLKCRYAPPGLQLGDSYFLYTNDEGDDYCISTTNMISYVSDLLQIPEEYTGLLDVFWDAYENDYNVFYPTESFKAPRLRYFHEGYNYYQVPIKHFGGNLNPLSYGYYGVVRNNIYTISLKSLMGPGGISIADGPFLSAQINVMPWGEITTGSDIGETMYSFISYNYYYQVTDTDYVLFRSDHEYKEVGASFPTITEIQANPALFLKYYEEIRAEADNLAPFPVLEHPGNTVVSADDKANVIMIKYKKSN
ncbi:Mfa1 family fimbria major subunit [Parabacteroides sp. OttesenSCG-928-G06]|nr:Mfa1 family fimbria major subunit [Parabacteroides sp. OttesenSCG-928-K15]MDL2281740.1 Mfa1 family fimbria major subunit [Parabacteroides sp. OttesenSCG-928-G06]